MQCGSPQNDRLSKKLSAIEQRIEDVLMRLSQESGQTDAILRDLNDSISNLRIAVEKLSVEKIVGIGSMGSIGTGAPGPGPIKSVRSGHVGPGYSGELPSARSGTRVSPGKSNDIAAILRSDRSEALAMESLPLLDSLEMETGVQQKHGKDVKKSKVQKYTSLNMESLGIPFQERIARAQLALGIDSKQSAMSKLITDFLEDSESSPFALYYSYGFTIFTILGVVFSFLLALNIQVPNQDLINFFIDLVLLTETLVRFIFYPNGYLAIITGEHCFENMIDCCSAIPVMLIDSRPTRLTER